MADTTVDTDVHSELDLSGNLWGPYYINTTTGIIVITDGVRDIKFVRTTDGGATWATTEIRAGGVVNAAAWFDQENPSDTGTLVHIVWVDSTDNNAYYQTVDVSDASLGTLRTVDSTITVDGTSNRNRVAITKTVSGNLIFAFSTQTEIECYRSTDAGANWTDIADPFETATERDLLKLYPAATADNDDACGVFVDLSAAEISVKMWDNSAGTWTETSISTGVTNSTSAFHWDAVVLHSNSHVFVAIHSAVDSSTDDMLTFDLTVDSIASPTVTARTNIFTNQAESGFCGIHINQQNDDVSVIFVKGGTLFATVDALYRVSTDAMVTWGAEQTYSEAASDDIRSVHGGRTTGDDGGFFQPLFYNDDLTDVFVNLVNDVAIAAAADGLSIPVAMHEYRQRHQSVV